MVRRVEDGLGILPKYHGDSRPYCENGLRYFANGFRGEGFVDLGEVAVAVCWVAE